MMADRSYLPDGLKLGLESTPGTYVTQVVPGDEWAQGQPAGFVGPDGQPMGIHSVTWENIRMIVGGEKALKYIIATRKELGDTPLLAALYCLTGRLDGWEKAKAENATLRAEQGLPALDGGKL